jgi:hypothetical protein
MGHIMCLAASDARNIEALFFMLGWAYCGYHKICSGTHYAKLVFLHLVRSADHVLRSGASGGRNIDALFYMLGWARYRPNKMRIGTPYAKLVFSHPV